MWCQAGPSARIRPLLCCTTTSGSEALLCEKLETTSRSTGLILGMLSLFPRTYFAHYLLPMPGSYIRTVFTSIIDSLFFTSGSLQVAFSAVWLVQNQRRGMCGVSTQFRWLLSAIFHKTCLKLLPLCRCSRSW